MKTVLVTGSNGFTGKYIRDVFEAHGYQVVGLAFKSNDDADIHCDLTNKSSIRSIIKDIKPDGVIHLAALSFVGHQNPIEFYDVNVFGTLNLLEALDEEDISPEKIIIASSANIYGNPETDNVTEDTPPSPINVYATSKLSMEYLVKTWFDRFNIIITRPFNYTGRGQDKKFLVPKIVDHFKNNEKTIELGNIDIYRNYSDVRDIARAYLMLFESGAKNEIINLSSGEAYSIENILEEMSKIAGYEINVRVNPAFIRKNDIRVLNGSNEKLKAITGFVPEYSLVDTLKDMYL